MNTKFIEPEGLRNEYECLIYLVRHGESLGNLYKVVLGHTDKPLTEKGEQQAAVTADYLSLIQLDAIYSSDLARAYKTAMPHSLIHGLEINTDAALREMYFGDWEDRSVDDLVREYGDMYWGDWRGGFGTFTPPCGESSVSCGERMVRALSGYAASHTGGAILITSHAAAIRAAWANICGYEPSEWVDKVDFPTNASFSILGYRGGVFYPIAYSLDEYMGSLRTGIMGY